MRGYVVRTELTLAGRGIKLNGMQGGIGKSLFTVHWDESIFEIKSYSPTVTHDKIFVCDFCVL